MSLDALVAELRADPALMRNVTAWRTLAPRLARTMPWPAELDARLAEAGRALGVAQLYAHQAQAVAAALRGENVVLATGTASGKTLGYTLPVLHTLLRDPQATALLLFPTKALAHDQIAAMKAWLAHINASIPLRPYDGDTPTRHRAQIRKEARILVSNPDMLHIGILPHHPRWARFFRGLRYIVLDELHTYRGVFGGHVANVLRRLLRIAHFHGANPQIVAASATIANPDALAERLTGRDFVTLGGEADAAAYGRRHVIFYNPPLLASPDAAPRVRGKHNPELGLRASAADEAIHWTLRLLRADVQTILFARSRLMVELLLSELRERAARLGDDPDVIQGYRGGYLPSERRGIERDLREGRTRVVVATNALELGIDIGALDAAILVGYPGSIAATHQQMGRAGRRAATSLSMMIATPSPLDQYLVAHPDYFFGRSPEEARIDPDTLSLLASHVTCAAFELPFEAGEPFGSAADVEELLAALSAEGLLHRREGRFTWVGESYPAQSVSLRTATPDNVVIRTAEGHVIGTMDRPSAPRLVHEGAVYVHGGEAYLITALDWEQGIASAEPADLGYYTVASEAVEVERLDVHREVSAGGVQLSDEAVLVHSEPTVYRRVRMTTRETLGWGEIDLPAQVMETVAFRVGLSAALVAALADAGVMVAPLDYGPEWPSIRREILARDGERCRLCDAPAEPAHPLEVHHLTPLRTFLSQYPRAVALRFAHAPENLITLCGQCHRRVERARGARTALGGLATLLRKLAPIFLMCDPGDLGTTVEAHGEALTQPAILLYDAAPGGVGLTPRLVDLWPTLVEAVAARLRACACSRGCPSCVGPVGESEPGAKSATLTLLGFLLAKVP